MKISALAGAAVAAVSVASISLSSAFAADMKPVLKAPPPVAAAPDNWSGIYFGVHGGYGWSRNTINLTGGPTFASFMAAGIFPRSFDLAPAGFLGGATLGANWQFDRMVLGLETDISFGAIKGSRSYSTLLPFNAPPVPFTHTGEQKLNWLGTARARAGVTISESLLAFATGGLAYGGAEASTSHISNGIAATFTSCTPPTATPCPVGASSKTLLGWAVGGGLEYGSGPWSLKVEYLHYDLGNISYSYNDPIAPTPFLALAASTHFSGDIVRAGINYRFNLRR